MSAEMIRDLGPLGPLAGIWEGAKGDDRAPSDDRGIETNAYRERITLEPIGQVDNHEQKLFGLRYATTAWRLGADEPFHEELGYWLWEPAAKQVLRCFMVPRGMTVIAGGTVEPDATTFELAADVGSVTYGICSNLFLDREFKTVRYELKVTVHDENSFSYAENTRLQIKGQDELFDHTDQNTLTRVG